MCGWNSIEKLPPDRSAGVAGRHRFPGTAFPRHGRVKSDHDGRGTVMTKLSDGLVVMLPLIRRKVLIRALAAV
jgi:hypothetical protein